MKTVEQGSTKTNLSVIITRKEQAVCVSILNESKNIMLMANSEDPDQASQMRRLISIYSGRKSSKFDFSKAQLHLRSRSG